MEYLLLCFFGVLAVVAIFSNVIRGKEKALEREHKCNCHVPPTAMTVKYIRGIPEIDNEIEKRYNEIISKVYKEFDKERYKKFVDYMEKEKPDDFQDTFRKIKNKINDPRFAKNLGSVDSDILIYMFEKIGIIDFYFWIKEDKFYLVDMHHQGIGSFEFNLEQISCFCRKEDIEQERNLDNLMELKDKSKNNLGTVLLDGTITFNKSIFPQNIKVDEKITIIELIFNDKSYCGFLGIDAYEVFKNQIPTKELNYILTSNQTKPLSSVIIEMKELKDMSEEIIDKINKLSELKDYGLFTEEEYEEKMKLIFEKNLL